MAITNAGSKDLNPTERFSDRVKDYVKFRPSYPVGVIDYLEKVVGLKGTSVADIGSGTGIFSKLLLERGAIVEAVEPNKPMAQAAEHELKANLNFHSHHATAELTGLPAQFVDLITFAQAFHWVDPIKTRFECDRILKPGGKIALIWNDVDLEKEFGAAYDKFKWDFSDESFKQVRDIESGLDEVIPKFFKDFETKYFTNEQELDEEGLVGRYFSSSYAPKADSPRKEEADSALRELFARFQANGAVRLPYVTELFLGN